MKNIINDFMKKLTITGVMAVLAVGVLTACTKTEESSNNSEASAAGDDLLQDENGEGIEAPEADGQDIGEEDAASADPSDETELMGMIEEIPEDSDDSFIIAKLVTEQVNGVDLISTDSDDTKITVVYNMDTKFTKRTVRGGGEDVKEEEGSAADLKENFTVEMKGNYYKENVFFAADVKIVEVVTE